MDRIHAGALAVLTSIACAAASPSTAAAPPAAAPGASRAAPKLVPGDLRFEAATVTPFGGTAIPAEIGRRSVPESRDRDSTHLIRLAFYRLRSTAKKPGTPIVFLAGGPGVPGSAMIQIPAYFGLFQRLRETGDVIVLDQRGTGLTQPSLACRSTEPPPPDMLESETKALDALRSRLAACAEGLRSTGVVIESFQTNENADDVEDLRRALGTEKIRLVGASYGTELALAMMRRHPTSVERAVLAGVRGPDQALKLPSVLDLQLRRISDLARRDSIYGGMRPDFESLTRELIGRLEKKPLALSMTDPGSGRKWSVRVGAMGLQGVLQNDLSDASAVRALPAMIYSLAQGDPALFLRRIERLNTVMAAGISAMTIAMDCASGASDERRALVAREAAASPLGNVRNLYQSQALCDVVGNPDLGAPYRTRIYSRVPALFLSGSLDPITPPFQAEEVCWGFPQGVHLVVENGFHETLIEAKVQDAAAAYLRGEDVRGRRIDLGRLEFSTVEEAKTTR